MELNKYKNIYFIGIGGSGMSALANYFVLENKMVGGYDKTISINTNNLESKGVKIIYSDRLIELDKIYMNKNNTLVIYTPAIPSTLKILDYFISNDFVVIKRSWFCFFQSQRKQRCFPCFCLLGNALETITS